MARDRYSPGDSLYGDDEGPARHEEPSIYGATPSELLTSATPVKKNRRLVKPIGILGALATIAAGGAVYMVTSHAAAAVNADCTLVVPPNPLSAAGLATPYQLVATNPANGPCNEANAGQSAFVQGAILAPNGQLTLYDPLVIDQGTKPLAAPAPANVPAGSVVGLWFGFNGANLTLKAGAAAANNAGAGAAGAPSAAASPSAAAAGGTPNNQGNRRKRRQNAGVTAGNLAQNASPAASAAAQNNAAAANTAQNNAGFRGNSLVQGRCVNGLQGSIFGQFAYCNAPAFFRAARAMIANNTLQVPALGTAKDGLPCPTVRDFSVVDQDQSDNVVTNYLANGNGQTGQNNAATRAAAGATTTTAATLTDLANGSDNRLLDAFVLPTLGCTAWMKPNGAQDGLLTSSLPLNELQAAMNQAAPIALVPLTDPMVLNNNNASNRKDNLYRAGVDQNPLGAADAGNGTTYCKNLFTNAMGIQRVFKGMAIFQNGPSPDPAAATNLFTFLAMRANQSFTNLNCNNLLNVANPIALTMNNGVVTAATFTAAGAAGAAAGGAASPSASAAAAAGTGTAATPSAVASPSAAAAAGAGGVAASPSPSAAPVMNTTAQPSYHRGRR